MISNSIPSCASDCWQQAFELASAVGETCRVKTFELRENDLNDAWYNKD